MHGRLWRAGFSATDFFISEAGCCELNADLTWILVLRPWSPLSASPKAKPFDGPLRSGAVTANVVLIAIGMSQFGAQVLSWALKALPAPVRDVRFGTNAVDARCYYPKKPGIWNMTCLENKVGRWFEYYAIKNVYELVPIVMEEAEIFDLAAATIRSSSIPVPGVSEECLLCGSGQARKHRTAFAFTRSGTSMGASISSTD